MNHDAPFDDPSVLLAQDARLRALARRLVHDAALADDVVQETWARALRGSSRVESRLAGWISGIARHVAFGIRRRSAMRAHVERRSEPPASPPSTAELHARESARREVVAAVLRLAEPARTAIVLRYFDDLSAREIARRIGAPVETVRTRIKRALAQLRADLDRAHGGDGRAWCAALAPIVAMKPGAAVGGLASCAAAAVVLGCAAMLSTLESDSRPIAVGGVSRSDGGSAVLEETAITVVASAHRVARGAPESAVVRGRVVDAALRPVHDARVELRSPATRRTTGAVGVAGDSVAATDADGWFALDDAPLPARLVNGCDLGTLRVDHPSFTPHWHRLDAANAGTIVLATPARVEGVVLDATTGRPVPGADVAIESQGAFTLRVTQSRGRTDDRGRFALIARRDAAAIVVATVNGAVPAELPTHVGDVDVHRIDVEIPPGRSVTLEVRDATTQVAVAGAQVVCADRNVDGHHVVLGVTGPDGRCSVEGVPITGYRCTLLADSARSATAVMIPPQFAFNFDAPVIVDLARP